MTHLCLDDNSCNNSRALESYLNVIDSCGDRQCGACQSLAPRLSGDRRPVREEVIRRYIYKETKYTWLIKRRLYCQIFFKHIIAKN